MANKKVFTDESLATFVDETKSYADTVASSKANIDHNHDEDYDAKGSAEEALNVSKEYTNTRIANMIFIGTYAEYETAYANGEIPNNTFVIITDDESDDGSGGDNVSTSTSSLLGTGVLGYMILG